MNLNSRHRILKNSLWGHINIIIRYGVAFFVTMVVARRYGAEGFGVYQLILGYVGILDGIGLLSLQHLQNHLIKNPQDRPQVVGAWAVHAVALWAFISLVVFLYWIFNRESSNALFLLIAIQVLFFKVFEIYPIILAADFKNDLEQKVNLLRHSLFNLLRFLTAFFGGGLWLLFLNSSIQAMISTAWETVWIKKLGYLKGLRFSLDFMRQLIWEGRLLTLVAFASALQGRFMGIILVDRMSPVDFGALQLVLRMLEPIMALGMSFFASNYSVLHHTRNHQNSIFVKRFLKFSAIAMGVNLGLVLVLLSIPHSLLVQFFGQGFAVGLNCIEWGLPYVVTGTVFAINVQLDLLRARYLAVFWKIILLILFNCLLLFQLEVISIKNGLLIYSMGPLFAVLLGNGFNIRFIRQKLAKVDK